MPLQNPSTGKPFQWSLGTGTVEASAGRTGRHRRNRGAVKGIPKSFRSTDMPHPDKEVKEMIDIQDIEVMAEALTCGSYNKG
ncbi:MULTISPECIES: hypothetical protein [unclassified Streptomyces]|uniref:hypothetical protein n=1 Tax=unclassified Streptomyces TaxID=2593676 RepID=UPI002E0D7291|nr:MULTISPECIES: hypothetical protein [unclassified Streptomyces]WSR26483.1 hypothetical protein OG573_10300 [Streptomyces sp. NBC_01205]